MNINPTLRITADPCVAKVWRFAPQKDGDAERAVKRFRHDGSRPGLWSREIVEHGHQSCLGVARLTDDQRSLVPVPSTGPLTRGQPINVTHSKLAALRRRLLTSRVSLTAGVGHNYRNDHWSATLGLPRANNLLNGHWVTFPSNWAEKWEVVSPAMTRGVRHESGLDFRKEENILPFQYRSQKRTQKSRFDVAKKKSFQYVGNRQNWTTFCGRHFQVLFLEGKVFSFDSNFTEVCS